MEEMNLSLFIGDGHEKGISIKYIQTKKAPH
jgi:hypothetical protein